MTNKTPKNGKNPFKIFINIEEEIKKTDTKDKHSDNLNQQDQNIDLIDKDILDTPVEEETKKKEEKKTPPEIPKIKVLEVASGGVEIKDPNDELKANILVKNIKKKKKMRKIIKNVGIMIFFVSMLGLGFFGYYNKKMLASILGVQPIKVEVIKNNYKPLDIEEFSPNTRFFYEIYLRDYDYIYKNAPSTVKTSYLASLNVTIIDFIKNKIDYATFRRDYGLKVYRIYKNILNFNKNLNKIKKHPNMGDEQITGNHLSP